MWTLTATNYRIRGQDRQWMLEVRVHNSAWLVKAHYRNPFIAMIHGDYLETR
jgi:hypothetical protein